MTGLEAMLRDMADQIAPLDPDWPDSRRFMMDENPDAGKSLAIKISSMVCVFKESVV